MLYYRVFLAMIVCLCLSTVGLRAEGGSVAELRERVMILDQARNTVAVELTAKEQKGRVSNRDQEHYRTVTAFLEQQIAELCSLLVSKGGETSTTGLPCLSGAVNALQKVEDTKTATPAGDQIGGKEQEKEQEKVIESEEQLSPASVVPPETAPVNEEKMERTVVPPQETPAIGFFATIRRWWKSLFVAKPPPAAPGSETGNPIKQSEQTATQEEEAQPSGDSSIQQAVQDSVVENPDAAGGTGNNGLSTELADGQQTIAGEKGAGQKQKQQQGNGDEQAVGSDAKGAVAVKHQENKIENSAGSVGSGTTKQSGVQSGSSLAETAKAGAGRKVAEQEGAASGQQQKKEGAALSGTGEGRAVDVAKGANTEKRSGRKDGTGQQDSPQPAGQAMVNTEKKQSGSVGQGSEKKDAGHLQTQSAGTPSVADREVAKLEKSLSDAMSEFDGKLLSEQERLATRLPKQREGSTAASGGYGAEEALGSAGGGGGAGGAYGGYEEQGGDSRAGAGGPGQPGSVTAHGATPESSADRRSTLGTDDDIVARQLREAAEKETDPVLKEKLWQEYRKYKQGGS